MSANTLPFQLHSAPVVLRDPGASGTINVDRSPCIVNLTSAGAETRTLALPTKQGAIVSLHHYSDGGDITLTVASAYNELGDTTLTFSDVGQYATFVSFMTSGGVYFWRLVSNHILGNMAKLAVTFAELDAISGVLATAAEINRATDLSTRIVDCTASTLALTLASHSDKIVTLNRAAGIAVTLPAATGTGARFNIFVGTTVTSNNITITRAGSDTMFGMVYQLADGGSTLAAYECPGSTVITLNGTTTGGIKGDYFILEDVATATWRILGHTSATGTEATPVT